VARLPAPLGRVLDVGCGEGGAAALLRDRGAEAIVGVEPHPPAAARAALVYDRVLDVPVEAALPSLEGPFDTILAYDVLEHLVDPGAVVSALRERAAPGAHLHVSVPNARHFSLVRDLVVRGTFGYTEFGHRDATHLRWFTKRDMVALLEAAGWTVERCGHGELRPVSRVLARLTGGRSAEFLVYQLWFLARA
jgi:2-polyprenyl-3-methyl-5-hydroxy-6-metoxy-1,4-benzoquinol methylase